MECKVSYIASCVAVIMAGLLVLYSLIAGDPLGIIGYALVLEAIGVGMVTARGRHDLVLYTLVAVLALAAPLAGLKVFHIVVLVASFAAAVQAGTSSIAGGLAWLATPLFSAEAVAGEWALPVYGSLAMLAASVLVFESTRKGHAFILASLTPVAFAMGPLALAAGVSALAAGVFASGLTNARPTCPFRRDALMAMVGSGLSLIGLLWAWHAGLEAGGYPHVVWVTGMLFLEAASLVPLGPSDSRPSWGASSSP